MSSQMIQEKTKVNCKIIYQTVNNFDLLYKRLWCTYKDPTWRLQELSLDSLGWLSFVL